MNHSKYGILHYRVSIYTDGVREPYEREFDSWQAAYAYAKSHITTNAAAIHCVDVVKHGGPIFTGIFRWRPAEGRVV